MRIPLTQLATKYNQAAQLLESGAGIESVYNILFKNTNYKPNMARTLIENLHHSRVIPTFDLRLLESAESTGKLPQVLRELSTHYAEQTKFRDQIFSSSNYTFVLFGLILTIPIVTNYIKDEVSPTSVLVQLGLIWGGGITVYTLIRKHFLSKEVRQKDDGFGRFFARVPFLSKIYWNFQFHWFYTMSYFFVDVGAGPIKAIEFFTKENKDSLLTKRFKKKIGFLKKTPTFAEYLRMVNLPDDDVSQIEVGERAGTLPASFKLLQNIYKDKCTENIKNLSFWIPKILYGLFLAYAAYHVVSSFTAHLNEVNQIIDDI